MCKKNIAIILLFVGALEDLISLSDVLLKMLHLFCMCSVMYL